MLQLFRRGSLGESVISYFLFITEKKQKVLLLVGSFLNLIIARFPKLQKLLLPVVKQFAIFHGNFR